MKDVCYKYLEQICKLDYSLEEERVKILNDWAPDVPPVTTLFGTVGAKIAENFEVWSAVQKMEIFRKVEEGMTDGDEDLHVAVSTGLIEAMVGAAFNQNKWMPIKQYLGPRSKVHAEAWVGE